MYTLGRSPTWHDTKLILKASNCPFHSEKEVQKKVCR